jgi:hypothetical protein
MKTVKETMKTSQTFKKSNPNQFKPSSSQTEFRRSRTNDLSLANRFSTAICPAMFGAGVSGLATIGTYSARGKHLQRFWYIDPPRLNNL